MARVLTTLLGTVCVAGVAIALHETSRDARGPLRPSATALGLAALLVGLGHLCGAIAWERCLGRGTSRLRRAYYASQLGKYLPGGIWQPVGQVGIALGAGLDSRRVLAGYVASQACFVAAGASIVGVGLVVARPALPGWALALTSAGVLVCTSAAHRPTLARVLDRLPSALQRRPIADSLPSQQQMVRCTGWSVAKVLLQAASFAIVLGSIDPSVSHASASTAYVAAWLVGIVFVPIPSGIGIREAALVMLLASSAPATAAVLAASVGHRAPVILAELCLAAATWRRRPTDARGPLVAAMRAVDAGAPGPVDGA